MAPAGTITAPIRFKGWELRPAERALFVNDAPVVLGGRAFELLLALVAHRGRVVTKAELLESAWEGLVVEENNVSVQIATLRKVLGAKTIVTIAGRGYQLSAEELPAADADPRMVHAAADAGACAELLGRGRDLAEVAECLVRGPLLTVVGPGGVGKTALAREAFARHGALVQLPSHWVDLAPIRREQQVVPLIAKALGVDLDDAAKGADGLVQALSRMDAFVAIDNCEHVVDEVARFLGVALTAAPGVRWLATSQKPLRVLRETVYRLEPLTVPAGLVTPTQALEFGAIALLCARVADADRRFRLDEANLPAVVGLCRALDGLPLAIEMSAARVATLGLADVCRRLGQRLKLLTSGATSGERRHATLAATYDWSHELLSADERAVFRRLEPFLGGFRAEMAQKVVGDDAEGGTIDSWRALDALGSLVDKSLVQRSAEEPGRFFLLESARDYARAQLDLAGETAGVQARHARAVAASFALAQADADRMTDAQWLRHYAAERHNARSALAWAGTTRSADELALLVTALSMMDWFLCGQAEVLLCDIDLALLGQATPARRASAYLELGWAHHCDGSHVLATELAQAAFDLFAELGESALAYRALAQLTRVLESRPGMADAALQAWTRFQQFDDRQVPLRMRLFCAISGGLANRPEFQIERMREFGRLAAAAGFDAQAAICGCNLTNMLLIAGQFGEAVETADRLLQAPARHPRATAFILHNKAAALISLGRVVEAYAPARRAFQTMPSVGHFLVDTFALGALKEGRLADAALLHGCGAHVREELHEEPDSWECDAIAETAARLAAGMTDAERLELMRMGAAMSVADALEIMVFAREPGARATAPTPSSARDPSSSLDLTRDAEAGRRLPPARRPDGRP